MEVSAWEPVVITVPGCETLTIVKVVPFVLNDWVTWFVKSL
jgi:hypothetical protein